MNQSFFWLHYFCCSWIRSLGTEPLDDNSPTELQRWKNALCPLKEEKVEQKHLVRLGSNSTEVRDADLLELVNISDPNNERLGSHGNKRNLPNWTPYWHPRTSQTSSKHREKFNSYQNTVWITTNCGKFLKRWKYQTTLPASWEICMQLKKQQLELDLEQQTGSKLVKEYVKAVYCHLAYLTDMRSTSCKIPGWKNDKLKSRLPGEITTTSDM